MRLVGVEQEAESTGGEEDGKGDNFFGFYLLSLSLSRGDWEHFDVKRLRSSIRAFTDLSKKTTLGCVKLQAAKSWDHATYILPLLAMFVD